MIKITPIILAGGTGTRLWPLSRKSYPKQFLSLLSNKTMLQETILRLLNLPNVNDPIIICNNKHRFLVAEQCRQIGLLKTEIILEPTGKNTAPAITAGVLHSKKKFGETILLVLSSDHVINNINKFHKIIKIASKEALKGKIVTFGVQPNNANTNYGYIKVFKNKNSKIYDVQKFVEKPNPKLARNFLKDKTYLWNSGIFIFKTTTIIEELNTHSPEIFEKVSKSIELAINDLYFVRLDKEIFNTSPSISIDYALMEKTKNICLIPLDTGWSDVGSWSTLYDISSKDNNGNVIKGDIMVVDTKNSYIYSPDHIITTIGVRDLIIIYTPDATLITNKNKAHEVKSLVQDLEKKNRLEANYSTKVYRPWGWFEVLEKGENFQVKRLHVKPKAKLSLQMHHKRSEHWVVVIGVATVTNGDENYKLTKGKSTFIPLGTKHSLENKTNKKLEIIEVQSGNYLGEDDIIRFEDVYGRN